MQVARLHVGDSIVPFALRGVDGKSHGTDGELRGENATVIVFTCNHCPYALAWEDRLLAIQRDYGDRGVRVAFINANDGDRYPADNFEAMADRAREKEYPLPYLHDETQEVARSYGAERTPEVFLFDGHGTLRYHGTVDDNAENPDEVKVRYLTTALESVLSRKNPAILATAPVGCTIKWKTAAVGSA